ncbi:MAG: glycosyltransferase family 2 protein [Eudoraea sp.]|nr:glycosyltransferase family 2 protein [Eudoraea sp.]
MKVAVIILNWNGQSLLERYLPGVLEHSQGAKVYVADNASTDDSVSYLKENHPEVAIVHNPENWGFAKGYNEALKNVDADVYCLLNSDVEVTPGWLEPVMKFFNEQEEAAIIQPKIRDLLKRDYFEYAGAAGGFLDRLGYPFCRGRIFQALEKDEGQYDEASEIFWATGACMFIRRQVFEELGGFDEDYFAHQEEVDLCWRAHNKGYKVFYIPGSHVFHLGGSTLSNMNPRKTYLNFRNSLFSITKNLPGRVALTIIFCRLILDGVAALRFVFQLKLKHCIAILRAHLSFYRQFRIMFRKREKKEFVSKYYATKSIVWSHYVNHIRKFSDLVKH